MTETLPRGNGYVSDSTPWWAEAPTPAEIDRQIRESTDEANALADMKHAIKPFARPKVEPEGGWKFPRAGVRLRADGRAQLRIWIDATLADPVHGGACESLAEAVDLGAMIVKAARVTGTHS